MQRGTTKKRGGKWTSKEKGESRFHPLSRSGGGRVCESQCGGYFLVRVYILYMYENRRRRVKASGWVPEEGCFLRRCLIGGLMVEYVGEGFSF